VRAALLLIPLLASCAAPQSAVEETVREVTTPTLAAAMASLGALVGGPVGAAVGAAAGALTSEIFVSKGTDDARKEGAADLWAVLNGDDPDTPLPKRLQRQAERVESVAQAVEEAQGETSNWLDDIKRGFWTAVLIASAVAALILSFVLWHYWSGSRVSRKLVADDDLYEPPR